MIAERLLRDFPDLTAGQARVLADRGASAFAAAFTLGRSGRVFDRLVPLAPPQAGIGPGQWEVRVEYHMVLRYVRQGRVISSRTDVITHTFRVPAGTDAISLRELADVQFESLARRFPAEANLEVTSVIPIHLYRGQGR